MMDEMRWPLINEMRIHNLKNNVKMVTNRVQIVENDA